VNYWHLFEEDFEEIFSKLTAPMSYCELEHDNEPGHLVEGI
jgi:hypothetical protein